MICRSGCAACCIAPSISSLNKPAGMVCRHLDEHLRCGIFGRMERPACCSGLQASPEMCGDSREQALAWLAALEAATGFFVQSTNPGAARTITTLDSLE